MELKDQRGGKEGEDDHSHPTISHLFLAFLLLHLLPVNVCTVRMLDAQRRVAFSSLPFEFCFCLAEREKDTKGTGG